MRMHKRILVAVCSVVFGIGAVSLAVADPGSAACAVAGVWGFDALPDGTLVEPGSTAQDRSRVQELLSGGRARIEKMFGRPRAAPIVMFFRDPGAFWPLKLNAYGSTNFVGPRACIMVGPQGQDLDVVAHELMHAELFERVGYWRRFTQIPTWFDEGLAMQVDFRQRYDLPKAPSVDTSYVRQLETVGDFFQSGDELLTRNYASAKAEVANWLGGGCSRRLSAVRAHQERRAVQSVTCQMIYWRIPSRTFTGRSGAMREVLRQVGV